MDPLKSTGFGSGGSARSSSTAGISANLLLNLPLPLPYDPHAADQCSMNIKRLRIRYPIKLLLWSVANLLHPMKDEGDSSGSSRDESQYSPFEEFIFDMASNLFPLVLDPFEHSTFLSKSGSTSIRPLYPGIPRLSDSRERYLELPCEIGQMCCLGFKVQNLFHQQANHLRKNVGSFIQFNRAVCCAVREFQNYRLLDRINLSLRNSHFFVSSNDSLPLGDRDDDQYREL